MQYWRTFGKKVNWNGQYSSVKMAIGQDLAWMETKLATRQWLTIEYRIMVMVMVTIWARLFTSSLILSNSNSIEKSQCEAQFCSSFLPDYQNNGLKTLFRSSWLSLSLTLTLFLLLFIAFFEDLDLCSSSIVASLLAVKIIIVFFVIIIFILHH